MDKSSSRASEQTALRLSGELRQRLGEAAAANGRTVSEEMRARLEASFFAAPSSSLDPWFADALAAIGHAAVGASKMLSPGQERDPAVYIGFEKAATLLLGFFRPEGDDQASDSEVDNAAAIVLGMALAGMGEKGLPAIERMRAKQRNKDRGETDGQ